MSSSRAARYGILLYHSDYGLTEGAPLRIILGNFDLATADARLRLAMTEEDLEDRFNRGLLFVDNGHPDPASLVREADENHWLGSAAPRRRRPSNATLAVDHERSADPLSAG